MRTLVKNAPRALANPEDYQVRSEISMAATFSCNAIISVGEGKSSWPMHAIENIINGYFDIQHGAGMAIVIPRWMSCVLKKYPETASRIATFGMKVFELGSDLGSEALSEAGDDFLTGERDHRYIASFLFITWASDEADRSAYDKGSRTKRRKATGNGETLHQDDRHLCCPQLRTAR